MKYRRFGKTELELPVITCGGMRFQHSWKSEDDVPEEGQRNVDACVRRSLELGIHHFETARGYGTSEKQLGKILPQLPRGEILVQTKVGPSADVGKFRKTFELSMSLLNLDYLDLFAFHGINNQETLDEAFKCMDAALDWKKQGRIRHIGFATHGPCDVLVKAIQTDAFEYINLHWFYIYQDNWPAIEEARKHDMGVYIISPNDKGGMLYNPSDKLCELTSPFHPMVFNGLFSLSHPEVHSLSCGVSCPEDFDLHMETAEKSGQAGDDIAPIVARLQREMEHALGKEWVATWRTGLPQWHETPNEINIPIILQIRNLAVAFDMVEFGKMRYNLLGNGGHWFPGKKADKLAEVDLSECLKDSPHRDVIPELLAETHAMLQGEERKRLQQDE